MQVFSGTTKRLQAEARIAAFALGVVLIGAADWELVAPGAPLPPICAKSQAVCEAAARAIREGRWQIEPLYTSCRPAAAPCFDARSLCIDGYNCPGEPR